MKKMREDQDYHEMKNCTHAPEIIRDEMPNDEKFIERNLNQIQDYVNKRRATIQKNMEEEKYKERRFNMNTLGKFLKKPTIPKEFNLTKCTSKEKSHTLSDFSTISKSPFKVERNSFHSVKNFRQRYQTRGFFDTLNDSVHKNIHQESEQMNFNSNHSMHDMENDRRNH